MTNRLLIAGMPKSGKSTFIAALKHVLVAEAVPTSLTLSRFADEEDHLNGLEDRWLSLEEIERTKSATEAWVELHVRRGADGSEAVLVIPDLRGEAYEQPACQGLCRTDVHEALGASDGLLVFTNADRPDDDVMISDLADEFDAGTGPEAGPTGSPVAGFSPDLIAEEAKIVELLQVPNRRPFRARRRRLALVISAWDVVDRAGPEAPLAWFTANRPMLAQFLRHNADLWHVRVYGVSAQGGRLPEDRHRLREVATPSERVRIFGRDCDTHDIAAPLVWMMGPGAD